jgi:glycerophosphoryl diester phosphodiesterase
MVRSRVATVLVSAALMALTGAAAPGPAVAERGGPQARDFDIQAHRGGLGLRSENTLSSFGNALRLGVTTLELDIQITKDGQAVVTHDRKTTGLKCADTAPAFPGDPEFPYIGRYIMDLTLAQVRTLDCGFQQLPGFPEQENTPGSRIPLLSEVFALVRGYHADDVMLNIETKHEVVPEDAPPQTAPREQFVQVVAREIREAGFLDQVTIQSFDWAALMLMRAEEPRLPIVALTNYDFLQVGQPGASPWLGGIDIDDFGGDPIAAIRSFGADAFSPVHGFPQGGRFGDPNYQPYVTKEMVAHAHRYGIKVIPWTVDDPATLNKLIDDGVDGIITDYPDRLRQIAADRGFRLPPRYASPFDIQGHRGARAMRPENTLAAFDYALHIPEVSTLELDTGVSEDGQLVVGTAARRHCRPSPASSPCPASASPPCGRSSIWCWPAGATTCG